MSKVDLDAVMAKWDAATNQTSQDPFRQLAVWADVAIPVPALVAELRGERRFNQDAFEIITDLLDWMKRRQQGDPKLHPEEYFRLTEWAQRVLDDYDQATKETSQ